MRTAAAALVRTAAAALVTTAVAIVAVDAPVTMADRALVVEALPIGIMAETAGAARKTTTVASTRSAGRGREDTVIATATNGENKALGTPRMNDVGPQTSVTTMQADRDGDGRGPHHGK